MNDTSLYVNSVFEQIWWLKAVAPNWDWKEIFVKDGDMVIARWVTISNAHNMTMPVQTQTLGFWIHPDILDGDKYYNRQKELINILLSQMPSKSIAVSLAPENKYFLPFVWSYFKVYPRISYRITNLSDINAVYFSLGKIVKKNIKSANNKVCVREIDDISLLYKLMEKTFAVQKRKYPFTIELFERIYSACKAHNACKLLYAIDKDSNIHSGTLFVYDEHVCYYLIAGTDPAFRSSGANSLLIWEGIKFASEHCSCFDFEGSMIENIEQFVRQFGGIPVVYFEVKRCGLIQDCVDMLKPYIKRIIGYK